MLLPTIALLWLTADLALSQGTPTREEKRQATPTATPKPLSVFIRYHGCDGTIPGTSQSKKNFITLAWDEFEQMVPYEWQSRQTYKYPWTDRKSAPWIDFFGPANHFGAMDLVEENIDRLASVRWGFLTFWSIDLRCDDPANACPEDPGDPCKPGYKPPPAQGGSVLAYTMHEGEYTDHINFCPGFFRRPALDAQVNKIASTPEQRDVLEYYKSRAFTVTHELLHVSWIANAAGLQRNYLDDIPIWPGSDLGAYRTEDAKYLAYSNSAPENDALNNVQNYAYYLLAQYVIQKKDFYPSATVWRTDRHDPPAQPGA